MKKSIVLLTLLLPLFLSGCRRYCYGVPEEIVYYFPYNENNNLLFVDNQGDSVIFNVRSIHKTSPKTISWDDKCGCEDYYQIDLFFPQTESVAGSKLIINDHLSIFVNFTHYRGGPMELTNGGLFAFGYVHSTHYNLQGAYSNDTLLFVAQDSLYFDSVWVVKDLGFTSFCTSDGHRYTNVSSLNKQNE